ncbi:PHB depolymerase family esterase [Nocardiopsis sp. JB363]|uniref:alpha/beta hydrolase family esterase n=1 Tax=Nocardiopsis sp. JB363 TaxID=1434837 RepID=UPI00097B4FDC|nr:poly(3-hydroxybutyrate) depolymerase [Nocardiopsis sp. JB363]SIO85356.1 LpqC [Nocardiopsis sp. JB363]
MSRPYRRPLARLTIALALPVLLLSSTATATATAAAPAPEAAPHRSDGCESAPPQEPGQSAQHPLTSGGLERSYRLHLPDDYDEHRAWPVVLAYHGRGNTGAGTEEFSGLSELPAVVVYPEGVIGQGDGDRQAWQGAPYSAPGVDDVTFTHDVLDTVESELCVDRGRVYATGKSNGGGFTAILACAASERVTAIAPVAAALYPNDLDCAPERRVPTLSFHGTEDATIPYAGDPERGLPDVLTWTTERAETNDCRPDPRTRRVEPDITEYRWSGCSPNAPVRHVAVEGGGHTWPGADSYSGGGHTTQTIEAHEEMWRFMSRFRLPLV